MIELANSSKPCVQQERRPAINLIKHSTTRYLVTGTRNQIFFLGFVVASKSIMSYYLFLSHNCVNHTRNSYSRLDWRENVYAHSYFCIFLQTLMPKEAKFVVSCSTNCKIYNEHI